MSGGVDSYGEVAAGLAMQSRAHPERLHGAPSVEFDRRPGFLEATKLDEAPVAVAGKKDGGRWMVLAIIGGFQVTMRPAVARTLAGQLVTYAELCDSQQDPSTTLRAVPLPETSSGRIR